MRTLSALLLAVVWICAFVATHLPQAPGGVPVSDKALHSTGFVVLAGVLGLFLAVRYCFSIRWLAFMMAVLAAYAVFDEWTQALVPNRTPDLRDWLADLLGAAIGTALIGCVWWLWERKVAAASRRDKSGSGFPSLRD